MKINQTLKREFVLKTVEVELKAIKEANELKLKENKFRKMQDGDHISPLPRWAESQNPSRSDDRIVGKRTNES